MSTQPSRRPLAYRPDEAAAALGISAATFYRHIYPDVRRAKVGSTTVIPAAELERWLDEHAVVPLAAELDHKRGVL